MGTGTLSVLYLILKYESWLMMLYSYIAYGHMIINLEAVAEPKTHRSCQREAEVHLRHCLLKVKARLHHDHRKM